MGIFLSELLVKKSSDTFKRLRAVMKNLDGGHQQIIKTMQDQIDYLTKYTDICSARSSVVEVSGISMVEYAT